ncbi:MAG TPA: thioesterase family protein [Roseiarcus sp.]|nr:thioesterase family protein [Roseiarcus sp.]
MTPLHALDVEVAPDWIDYNGHMNDACYAVAFSRAGDAFIEKMGLGPDERAATKRSIFTLALVIRFIAEAKLGERLAVSVQILERDMKRLRVWFEARRGSDGASVATSEQVFTCVDLSGERPRAAEFPPDVAATIEALAREHEALPMPLEAGQGLTLRRRSAFSVTP